MGCHTIRSIRLCVTLADSFGFVRETGFRALMVIHLRTTAQIRVYHTAWSQIFWKLAPANTGLVLTEAWCDSIRGLLQIAASSLPTSWSKRRRCLRSCGHQTRQTPHRQLPRCLRIATAQSGAVRGKDSTALSAKAHTLC